jgi:hypothetical protein
MNGTGYGREPKVWKLGREALALAECDKIDKWELKENQDISWWHCGRAGYWEGDDVYCSKCQNKLKVA